MNAIIKFALGAVVLSASASQAFAQDMKIDSFKSDVNITDSAIVNTATGVRSTAVVELGSARTKGGDIKINSFASKVTVKDSKIINAAIGIQARSIVSVGSASSE